MPVIRALQQIGIESELSGRNDILIDGKKFSGNAQCMNKTKLLHHGTLMFDVKIEDLVEALNVSQLKIESKAIESVRSRVANLKDYLKTDMTIEEFKEHLIRSFYETVDFDEYVLTDEDKAEVQKRVDETFSTWEYNFGRSPEFAINKKKKYNAGIVEAHLNVADGMIRELKLYGDFFSLGDIGQLEELLKGVQYEETAIRNKLQNTQVGQFIVNLTNDEFADLLFY
jgi:lipoate-protein ligase A